VSFGHSKDHENITAVLWRSASTPAGHGTREAIVAWLQASSANQAVVAAGSGYVQVAVVRPVNRSPHLRTHVDGAWRNDLLALPMF
jgi:hypothetical protein